MIRSMTGFGTATADSGGTRFTVEIRSVNHRFSEVMIRAPRDLAPLEDRVRGLVQGAVQRGRVEVTVTRDAQSRRPRTVRPDVELAAAHLAAARELAHALHLHLEGEVTLGMLLSLPDVIRLEEPREDTDALWEDLEPAVAGALGELVRMREAEGRRLAADFTDRLGRLDALVEGVGARAPRVTTEHAGRLRERLQAMLGEVPVDENRLAMELALVAERSDISEELTRLRSHLGQFRHVMAEEGAVGRKLEFLLQEMGREANTIGSKTNDLDIVRAVIAIKSELESLREQVQNIE